MLRRHPWIIGIFILTLWWAGLGETAAQGGVDRWLRYDVNLTLQQNSGVVVEEVHEVALVSGATSFQRVIPTDRLESVGNFQVLQIDNKGSQRTFQLADTKAEYTFEVVVEPGQQTIQLYFPPNNVVSTLFILRYFVTGALRFYDTGDQLDWQPLDQNTNAPVVRSSTIINLPGTFANDQVVYSSSGVITNNFFQNANKITFIAADIPPQSELEVSVTFPHGVVQGSPPAWQRKADSLEFWTPILQWGSVILGLFILLIGSLMAYGWWYLRLRISPGKSKVPNHLKSLPDNLTPAVAGALLDGHAQPRHILATLLDMAYHGALNIDTGSKSLPLTDQKKTAFNLYAVDPHKVTQPYEIILYGKIFGSGGQKRDLTDIHETLFMSTPELKQQIDGAIAHAGYFQQGYRVKQRQYMAFGGAGVVMSLVLALLVGLFFQEYTYMVACPFLGIAATAIAFMVVGWAVPTKTKDGTKEAARWEAFKRFLHDISPGEAVKYKQQFTHWLPYAVAFGLEDDFVKKFAAAKAPKPKWWGQPEEKPLDLSVDQAYVWVSASAMETESLPRQAETQAKRFIHRLGQSDGEMDSLLKPIQPALAAFLKAGHDVFSKAPTLNEEQEVEIPGQRQ